MEIDPNDVIIKNRMAKVYYLYGVQYYDEKNYQVKIGQKLVVACSSPKQIQIFFKIKTCFIGSK
jgi:hypothetical protein